MKFIKFVITILLLSNTCIFADTIMDLQNKMNSYKKQGIFYNFNNKQVNDNYNKVSSIALKGNNIAFYFKSEQAIVLFKDGNYYEISMLYTKMNQNTPIMVNMKKDFTIDEYTEFAYKIPSYQGFKLDKKTTVNGYQCQKIIKTEEKTEFGDIGDKFLRIYTTEIDVIEKYGFPAKITMYNVAADIKTKKVFDYSLNPEKEVFEYTDYTTNLSDKIIDLPKNAFVIDPSNPSSFDRNKLMQFQQKLIMESNEDEDEEED